MRQNIHCYWCGIATYFGTPNKKDIMLGSATVDHLDDKWFKLPDIQVYSVDLWSAKERVVLSCRGCNDARNALSQLMWNRWKAEIEMAAILFAPKPKVPIPSTTVAESSAA